MMWNIHEALGFLDWEEKEIIIMRFWLDWWEVNTLESVSNSFNISKEDIRIIELKTLNTLRRWNQSYQIESLERILESTMV